MAVYGYIRKEYPISTINQVSNLKKFELDGVFIEDFDFETDSELEKLLAIMKPYDYLVVSDLLVFAKIKIRFKKLLRQLKENKIYLISINDKINTSEYKHFYEDNLSVIKMQEKIHSVQVKESIENARTEGKSIGRPKTTPAKIEEMKVLYQEEGKSLKEISKICNISIATVYKYLYNY